MRRGQVFPFQIRRWHNQGLPLGQHATENAILMKSTQQWPLVIDPHKQALYWIRQMEGPQLQEISAEDSSYLQTLKTAMQAGERVLLHNTPEAFPPSLKAILKKDIFQKRGQHYIKIGGTEIEYNKRFRLYLFTELDNPHFLPSVYNFVTVINFTVTFQSLQDQLLSTVIKQEFPHLENQRAQLLESISLDSVTLEELEDKTLTLLQKTKGNVLDDEEIVETLRKSKMTSNEISKRIKETEKAEGEIEAIRKSYLPIATRGALLYFLMASLTQVDYMYQFSLQWFRQVFVFSTVSKTKHDQKMDKTSKEKHDDDDETSSSISDEQNPESRRTPLSKNSKDVIDTLTRNIFKAASSALFNEHKLCFSFRLCTTIMRNSVSDTRVADDDIEFLPEEEWNIFLYSGLLTNIRNILTKTRLNSIFEIRRKEHLQWVTDLRWEQCQYLSNQMEPFSLLCRSLLSNEQQWNTFRDTKAVYFLMSTPFASEEALPLQSPRSSQDGIDLNNILLRFAQELKEASPKVTMISLGRGQAAKAEELIFNAMNQKNQWVFLQNCHLAASFMPRLCAIIESFSNPDMEMDPDFRLWLSSKSYSSFPIPILQKGVKIAVEPPQGLKSNLLQTFGYGGSGEVTEEIFDKNDCGPWWKKILFSLCFFNAVINERKIYGTLGWNVPYQFSSSDLAVSIKVLGSVLLGRSEVPWKELNYLIGEVTYGGRVTNKWDKQCLKTLFNKFCNPEMLKAGFSFSSDEIYQPVPNSASLQDCINLIQSLPDDDSPEILGIHPEATHIYNETKTEKFIENLITLQRKDVPVNLMMNPEQSNDDLVMEILSDIKVQLPLAVETEDVSGPDSQCTFKYMMLSAMWEKLQKSVEGHDPLIHCVLITYLNQEIQRFDKLLSIIHKSLKDLELAIKGKSILTQDLEEIYDSFLRARVPKLWQKNAYKSCKPLSFWVSDLLQRVNFFNTWAKVAYTALHQRYMTFVSMKQSTTLLANQKSKYPTNSESELTRSFPSRYWLPAFFNPQAFLTAVLQDYGRAQGVSMDAVLFTHRVINSSASSKQEDDFSQLLQKRLKIVRRAFQPSDQQQCGTPTTQDTHAIGAAGNFLPKSSGEIQILILSYSIVPRLFNSQTLTKLKRSMLLTKKTQNSRLLNVRFTKHLRGQEILLGR
ncbi:dynein heavy chain 14, axonemal-like protein [Cricetulus griseus]|nr:dynein heavy chain 14, axonemal-like protein [Cricetulus griseus]